MIGLQAQGLHTQRKKAYTDQQRFIKDFEEGVFSC